MAYQLRPKQPIGSEVRRVADNQLELALADLHNARGSGMEQAQRARRRVKKVRALVRLVEPGVGATYAATGRRLRTVKRLLGAMTDSKAAIDTLARLQQKYPRVLPNRTFQALRKGLRQSEIRAARKARLGRTLDTAIRLLRAEQKRARLWLLTEQGFGAIESGLLGSVRHAEKARCVALHDPTTEHHHRWRRRAKELWLQIRLLQAGCRGQLASLERPLERLDGILGEHQNCAWLRKLVVAEALVSREQTARCLHLIRRYQSELLQEARIIADQTRIKEPRRFVKRVRRLWEAFPNRQHRTPRSPWPRAA